MDRSAPRVALSEAEGFCAGSGEKAALKSDFSKVLSSWFTVLQLISLQRQNSATGASRVRGCSTRSDTAELPEQGEGTQTIGCSCVATSLVHFFSSPGQQHALQAVIKI